MLRETSQGLLLPIHSTQPSSAHNGGGKINGGFADSAFSDNKQRPIHRWVPWIAGFSSEFVRDAFRRYLPETRAVGAVVLDPFCGVGTTLIEALRCGHDAVGFEINPYAALAARAKCEAATVSPGQLNQYILKFEEHMRAADTGERGASVPEHFRSRIPFFGTRTEAKVLKALSFINRLRVPAIHDLFSLAFGSVMVSELKQLEIQNFGKYWQTVRDLERVPLDFESSALDKILAQIRSISVQRGIYGGAGWANYAASYFNDTHRFCRVANLYESAVVLRRI